MCVYACEIWCLWRPGAVDSLKVELQAVESHLMWVLGTKLRCSAPTASALNFTANSMASINF